MTWGMHAIGYKDLNQFDEAAQYFNKSFQLNMQQPFMVWTETPTGNAGNFITGAGGFLHTVVFGYPGLRIEPSRLLVSSPACIEGSSGTRLRGVSYLQSVLDIAYTCSRGNTVCEKDKPSELSVSVRSAGEVPLELVVYAADSEEVADVIPLKQGAETVSISLSCGKDDVNSLAIRPVTATM
jgi:hypothetical protein